MFVYSKRVNPNRISDTRKNIRGPAKSTAAQIESRVIEPRARVAIPAVPATRTPKLSKWGESRGQDNFNVCVQTKTNSSTLLASVSQKYIRIPLEMSPEPTSVAAISPTSNVFPHNLFPKEYNTSNYNKSIQTVDTRAHAFLTSLNNIPSPASEVRDNQDVHRIQRHQILNGSHTMSTTQSNPRQPSSSSIDGNHERLTDRSSHETKRNGSLDLLVAAAVAINLRDSEYSNIETANKSSPPASEVDIKLEQKRLEHERQRNEQRKRFEAQMKILELQQLREEQDLLEKHHAGGCSSVQSASAPNTPPSLASNDSRPRSDTMQSSMDTSISHPNQFDSIHSESSHNIQQRSHISSRSVPNSRRNSNETPEKPSWSEVGKLSLDLKDDNSENTEKDFIRASIGKSTSNLHKNSVRLSGATSVNAPNNDASLFPQFNGNFLLDDDGETSETGLNANPSLVSSSYVRRYLQMHGDDDKFPILVRRDSYPGMLSASSAALDLASLRQTPSRHRGLDSILNADWAYAYQHQSDELLGDCPASRANLDKLAPLFSENQVSGKSTVTTPAATSSASNTGSSNGFSYVNDRKKMDNIVTENSSTKQRIPKLSTSYSTPDLASATRLFGCRSTILNSQSARDLFIDSDNQMSQNVPLQNNNDLAGSGICRFFQQGFCSWGDRCQYAHTHTFNGIPPVNMGLTTQLGAYPGVMPQMNNTTAFYGQYGMTGIGGISMIPGSNGFGYNQNFALNAALNNNANGMRSMMHVNNLTFSKTNQKRLSGDLEVNRFTGVMLEDLVGEIYSLCKDQHGCRYLQKKLEEKNEQYIGMIFNEVFSHFVELMTDPFGNYLCQKLLEYCNDDQRTIIIETVAPELVNISLNMHGTRAVQKMIEFLSTPTQIRIVIVALNPNVVPLIKDLNGNHVIQKCLHRLSHEENQFIYNAVSKNCIEVATHRHGCCVLQRCIDRASESQKIQLVTEITFNALTLVQDPFGNYVVQYVLDLGDSRFTDALIRKFIGNVCLLSVQKFSSNVMEKCIRVAEPETRKFLIDEMLNKNRLDKLLRDSYANYVVQTSLDYADPIQRAQLVECIRPLLPAIRNTPYGKRIQDSHLMDWVILEIWV
ncbi:2021_t:CDS:10 [Cetraspora pellucida]|uniref:2021_t:CDS:1 n=1 Tax=Cetraspora pellucida TaxID=1433469 RepID=A0A9N9B7M0_9GLOM|nr:2021_t:CDS:10 [Cetraspora pellucida]